MRRCTRASISTCGVFFQYARYHPYLHAMFTVILRAKIEDDFGLMRMIATRSLQQR